MSTTATPQNVAGLQQIKSALEFAVKLGDSVTPEQLSSYCSPESHWATRYAFALNPESAKRILVEVTQELEVLLQD